MLTIYILFSVLAIISAVSAMMHARKKRQRANNKWKEFQKNNPKKSIKKDDSL